jgi:membrane-associated protease RseP (regulator of RpoE activity)
MRLPFLIISGIEVRHSGLQWIQRGVFLKVLLGWLFISGSQGTKATDFQYKFEPIYESGSVRLGSEAAKSGLLQGDLIVSINSKDAYKYSLKINDLFKVEEEKYIGLGNK